MKKIIGFSSRPNLKHPIQYYIYSFLWDIETTLLKTYLAYNDSLMFTPLMFIGEFFKGLIVLLYQKKFVNKTLLEVEKTDKYMNLELIKTEKSVKTIDSNQKMIFLLFCCAYFDFIQFIISISSHKYLRFGGLLLILVSLFYYYVLKLPIVRHQVFCLIIIGTCSLIVVVTEFIFQKIKYYENTNDIIFQTQFFK